MFFSLWTHRENLNSAVKKVEFSQQSVLVPITWHNINVILAHIDFVRFWTEMF